MAAIHLAGVRGEPCGAMRWTAVQCIAPQGSARTLATCIAATTPGLIVRILIQFFNFLNFSVTLTRYRPTP